MAETPRWLADEMLGRLARYLRFLGFDTAYVRGEDDAEVIERSRREHRTLLTRDVQLSRRYSPSVLLTSADISEQLRSLRDRFPTLEWQVRFDRCTMCNGGLRHWEPLPPWPPDLPRDRVEAGLEVFECAACGHRYWDGSHTAAVRRDVARWLEGAARP